jgi:hypothetical protein
MVRRDSGNSSIGHITLGPKQTGARSAGNLHAGCDVAGGWKRIHGLAIEALPGETGSKQARLDLRNTAPALDPTLREVPLIKAARSASVREHSPDFGWIDTMKRRSLQY